MNLEEANLETGYRALREGVGVLDLSGSGRIELSGGNAVQFLNGLAK
jgi:glycine cleavage system aminomethyltransferase T